jgi:hypothetical protein
MFKLARPLALATFVAFASFAQRDATACFCGLPTFISVLMFELMVLWEDPFLSGMFIGLSCMTSRSPAKPRGGSEVPRSVLLGAPANQR